MLRYRHANRWYISTCCKDVDDDMPHDSAVLRFLDDAFSVVRTVSVAHNGQPVERVTIDIPLGMPTKSIVETYV